MQDVPKWTFPSSSTELIIKREIDLAERCVPSADLRREFGILGDASTPVTRINGRMKSLRLHRVTLPSAPEFVEHRYNRLAPWYRLFEWILWLPGGIRARAVQKLELDRGQTVLEVGCGTGRNLPYLHAAIGPSGQIFGVDLSDQMLRRARVLCQRHGWTNVTLTRGAALEYCVPVAVDAALFSLSYSVMGDRERILRHVWSQLRGGGRLVIVDGKTIPGVVGRWLRPFTIWQMKATVLGDPDHHAVADLQSLSDDVHIQEELFGAYFVGQARKPCGRGTSESH
jgi:demethylmenaquinone methyltransferase/2-methoxy-6-polyprenyl-1,4-benzoquinol methylase